MRPGRRLTRWIALVAFAAAVLATQGVAAGALSGVSASLATQSGGTGAQSVSTPPGGVLSARVIANATGSSKWRATSWQIAPNGACADHSDQSGSGKSATFNVTTRGRRVTTAPPSRRAATTAAAASRGPQSAWSTPCG